MVIYTSKEGITVVPKAQTMLELYEMLPEQDKTLAYELMKRMVLAWDPDYTKLTPSEKEALDIAEQGEYVRADEIDWDN